jgi:hypothetical protein
VQWMFGLVCHITRTVRMEDSAHVTNSIFKESSDVTSLPTTVPKS